MRNLPISIRECVQYMRACVCMWIGVCDCVCVGMCSSESVGILGTGGLTNPESPTISGC